MFADIIIDISVSELDRTFQYIIPPEWEKEATVGACVRIPFGKGNRQIEGYIVALSDVPKYPVEKMKSVQSVEQQKVKIESKLLALAAFIRTQYGSTMNAALRTVLPVKKQVKATVEKTIHWVGTEEQWSKCREQAEARHFQAKIRLLDGIRQERGCMTTTVALKKYNVTKSVIEGFEKQKLVEVTHRTMRRIPYSLSVETGKDIVLNGSQTRVVEDFVKEYQKGIRRTYLLHGVTGSGKTEVYLRMMAEVLRQGQQVIALIPEIALTKQTVDRFRKAFGNRVSILNSRMSQGERYDQYCMAREGDIQIMVGPRSALFVPFEKVGLILIDEEHENSYKSDSVPRYHAREVAKERARLEGASVVLGSATPSIESYTKAISGEYKYYEMNQRAGEGTIPDVSVVDLREELKAKNLSIFSRELHERMEECLKKHEQMILFLNRRGYAGFVSCRSCGNVIKCPHCDVSLTAHHTWNHQETLECHYCGYHVEVPKKCPECGSSYIASFGLGTQKVEELTKKAFPQARIVRMDADTTSGKNGHESVLQKFRSGEADILIGTQMIVKGHDFPRVTLVGILAADLSMYADDYSAGERTFELLMQAAGRAGRDKLPGHVVIQTYNPEHYCIQAVEHQDYKEYYENEMAYRTMLHYPPVWDILAILVSSKEEQATDTMAKRLRAAIKKWEDEATICVGPAKAGIYKMNDYYRQLLYIKCMNSDRMIQLRDSLEQYLEGQTEVQNVSVQFDKNPTGNF